MGSNPIGTQICSRSHARVTLFSHMSGFLRTVSTLGQNFFACLPAIAGREALAVLQKPGGAPSWRVVVESLGAWLPAGTKGKAQQLSPGGWGG